MRSRFQLSSLLRPYTLPLIGVLAQLFVMNGIELLKPWPLQMVVDHVLAPKPWSAGTATLAALTPDVLILLACAALVAIFLASALLTLVYNRSAIRLGQAMVAALRGRIYAHLQRLSLAFHARQQLGDLMMRVNHDSFAVQSMVMNGAMPILSALILLVGIVIVLARINLALTAVSLLILPPLWIANRYFSRQIAREAGVARDRDSQVFSLVQWGMNAIKYVQAFNEEEAEHRRFMVASTQALGSALRLYSWQTFYSGCVGLIGAGGTALVIYVGAHAVLRHQLTLGELLVFTAYLAQLYTPINQITQSAGLIAGARIGLTRCAEILETEPDIVDGPLDFPAMGPQRQIEWKNVSFSYAADLPVLSGIDLNVVPGSTIALVGATGAGKSTLLSLLPRFFDPVAGEILIDGVDLRQFSLQSLRRNIAMVLQPPLVFPLSLRDNIAYGRPDASDDDIREAARQAHIDGMIKRLPQGYDTIVGEGGATLSEGEKQRLTIARALLRNAPLLILDEPTSALDAETESLVMSAVHKLREGRTIFIIAHRLSTVRSADQILVLKDGNIAESGKFLDLMQKGGLFASLHQFQFATLPEKQTAGEQRIGA